MLVRRMVEPPGRSPALAAPADLPGTGSGLTEGVQALGGTLVAGPRDPRGWRVAAVLPLEAS
jgi:hypothetical protein